MFGFFFQAEDGIRDLVRSRGLGDVYKRQGDKAVIAALDRIDPQQLPPADQLNRDLFRRQYQANIDTYDYGSQYTPPVSYTHLTLPTIYSV